MLSESRFSDSPLCFYFVFWQHDPILAQKAKLAFQRAVDTSLPRLRLTGADLKLKLSFTNKAGVEMDNMPRMLPLSKISKTFNLGWLLS